MAAIRISLLIVLIACACIKADSTIDDEPTSPSSSPTSSPSPSSDRSFSIEASNAPDPQYEWDAVQYLSEAYILHPNSFSTIIETFAQLFKLKHSGNWNVNAGCSSLYVPKATVSIIIKITEGADETLITLYG